jgi:MFS family permease
LLFSDHGISAAAMSSLFVIWSVTSFIFEVPSGAWADVVDRRLLLVLSAPVYAAGFTVWILWPTFTGFAVGFALWGLSSALMSGTFEAWLYDELAANDAAARYAGLLGWANASATAAGAVAIVAAAPLYAWGGYAAVAWASVAAAIAHGALAWTLPAATRREAAELTHVAQSSLEGRPFLARYIATLSAGVSEATRRPAVRHLVVIVAVLYGLTAYDEYFAVVAREAGASTVHVPLLVALTVAGQLVGSAAAGRSARRSGRAIAAVIAVAAALIAAGALAGHPAGFLALAVGYGLTENAVVVSDAKLQAGIEGAARATVTSVSSLAAEIVAVAIFVAVAAGTTWWSTSTMLAVVTLPALAIAAATRRLWPATRGSDTASTGDE